MDTYTNKIYARQNDTGVVIKFFSSVFEKPQDIDVLIEEGREDYHAHVQLKYKLTDEYGRYNYRIVGGKLEAIPESEKPSAIPEPTLEELRTDKLAEINTACENAIHSGTDIETSIGLKHFNLSDQDQINLLAYRAEIAAAMAGLPSQVDPAVGVWYKADSPGDTHRYWSVEDFIHITNTLFAHKVQQLTYCDTLKEYVRGLDDVDAIEAVTYGMKF